MFAKINLVQFLYNLLSYIEKIYTEILMSDENYYEIIKKKLDAIVDRIIQNETSDENFRVTYAQILEKINTKIDVFSSSDNIRKMEMLVQEIRTVINEKDENLCRQIATMLVQFEGIKKDFQNSLKSQELQETFDALLRNLEQFSLDSQDQKDTLAKLVSYVDKFETLESTNKFIENEFNIVKGQNAIINENLVAQIKLLNEHSQEYDAKLIDLISSINGDLAEIIENNKELVKKADINHISNKLEEMKLEIEKTIESVSSINNNIVTLIDVVDNLFKGEEFDNLSKNTSAILVNTTVLSEAVKKLGTTEDLAHTVSAANVEMKGFNEQLIKNLEEKLFEKLDLSILDSIKDYTEKMFYQGTEVLKEEIWTIKDNVSDVQKNLGILTGNSSNLKNDLNSVSEKLGELKDSIEAASQAASTLDGKTDVINDTVGTLTEIAEGIEEKTDIFTGKIDSIKETIDSRLDTIRDDIADTMSKESIAKAYQFENIADNVINKQSAKIDEIKAEITDVISEESIAAANQLNDVKKHFVEQLIQVAENISFLEEAEELHGHIDDSAQELKEKIHNLTEKIQTLTGGSDKESEDYVYTLPDVESDLSKIRLDFSNLSKSISDCDQISRDKLDGISAILNTMRTGLLRIEQSPIEHEVFEVKGMFGGLREDIASISKRTNKLVISSDEANKTLKHHIEEFNDILRGFSDITEQFADDAYVVRLNHKIDVLTEAVNSLISQTKVLNEAFMYLAEWIDTTSVSFNEIKSEIADVNENTGLIDEIARKVELLTKKVETQEESLQSVKQSFENLAAQREEESESKALLEYIASQISAMNEKANDSDKFTQRLDAMEKQLKKIEKNVLFLASYVDDEE